jgi:hypothetical protein
VLTTSDYLDRVARPIYLIALLLVLTPVADFLTNVWPIQPGEMRWRFGSTAVLAGFLFTPIIGALFAAVLAMFMEQKVLLRTIGVLCVATAAVLVLMTAVFAFDTLQLKRGVPPDNMGQFKMAAIRGAVKLLSAIVATSWLGMGCIKLSRTLENVQAVRQKPRNTNPIVGTKIN